MSARPSVLRALAAVAIAGAVAAGAFMAVAHQPAIAPLAEGTTEPVDAAMVARGAGLAALGDCAVCHTAEGGRTFAGGRPLQTPFGTIHGTNITPDRDTGIGTWPRAAFVRAMREGVDRAGEHLYPAFPYDHFRLATDDDLHALHAYVMTRAPVSASAPANRLAFPFNLRPLIAGWKLLYLDHASVPVEPARGPEWNRGAYLVAGLGHCGACHTPRNALAAEKRDRFLDGGEAEGWHAPALGTGSTAPIPWTVDELDAYLADRAPAWHGRAAGPMQAVVRDLAQIPAADRRAIAVFVASLQPAADPARDATVRAKVAAIESATAPGTAAAAVRAAAVPPQAAPAPSPPDDGGAALYAGACATCHDEGRAGSFSGAIPLALTSALAAPTPRNFFQVVLRGITPAEGEPGALMPPFDGVFTDAQLLALAGYVRARAAEAPMWTDAARILSDVRRAPGG